MPHTTEGPVVVITGASSGIGKATALEFGAEGARVVLAARRQEALHDTAAEVEARGGRALVVPTDVTVDSQVLALARRAIQVFGGIDVWVNNAAVTSFGLVDDTPMDVFEQILDTNVLGYVRGAKAVLPHFRAHGSGVLVLVDSGVAGAPQPYTAPYVMSKAAVRSFADCLRMELELEGASDVHVCTVFPATVDTPLFQHAANYTGRAPRALQPAYPAEKVARAIVRLHDKPKRETWVGGAGRLMAARQSLAPGRYERKAAHEIDRRHLQDQPAGPTDGNLFEPMWDGATVSGGWGQPGRAVKRGAVVGLAVSVPAALLLWSRRDDVREAFRRA